MLDHSKTASEDVIMTTTPEKQPAEDMVIGKITKPYVVHALRSAVYLVVMVWLAAVWIYSSAYEQTGRSGNIKLIVSDLDEDAIGKETLPYDKYASKQMANSIWLFEGQSLVQACANISGIDGMGSFHVQNMSFEEAYEQVWKYV